MQLKNTQSELERFAKYVIQQSRTNLTKGKKNVNKKLYNSLMYSIKSDAGSISVDFSMENYGEFVDKGVSGTEKKYSTPYSYRQKQPPVKALLPWVKSRGLRFRDEKGKFTRGTQKSLAFLIARSIKRKGIKPSLFFTKPFERGIDKYEDLILEAFGLDLETYIDFKNGK